MFDEGRTLDWLLAGDPAIRWQVLRDLTKASPSQVRRERERIGEEGWGRKLLDLQEPSGLWSTDRGPKGARGLYTPKWTSTHYTLVLLQRLGLSPRNAAVRRGCRAYVEAAPWLPSGGTRPWEGRERDVCYCYCAMVLSILEAFDCVEQTQKQLRAFLLGAPLAVG